MVRVEMVSILARIKENGGRMKMKVMLMKKMLEIREKKVGDKERERERASEFEGREERKKDFYRKVMRMKSDEDEDGASCSIRKRGRD